MDATNAEPPRNLRPAGSMKDLRAYTQARVGLGTAGDSLPTAPLLALRLAHAKARDAVRVPFDAATLREQMNSRGWPSLPLESAATTRDEYLRRPDLGRVLSNNSMARLEEAKRTQQIVFAVGDGLSAPAAERHAIPLLEQIFAMLPHTPGENQPIAVVQQCRVAIGDAIGEALGADLIALLIGERPGLSSPDSLGVYLTWQPRVGRTDAERNCVSNIHSEGLSYEKAAFKIVFLMRQMQRGRLSGVSLKDTSSLTNGVLVDGSS